MLPEMLHFLVLSGLVGCLLFVTYLKKRYIDVEGNSELTIIYTG